MFYERLVINDIILSSGRDSLSGEGPPARPQTPDLLDRHQSRREVWEPLDLWNREFLSHLRTRRSMPDKDFLKMNIVRSFTTCDCVSVIYSYLLETVIMSLDPLLLLQYQ